MVTVSMDYEDRPVPIEWLLGRLCHCTDTLPSLVHESVKEVVREERIGGSVAAAVFHLRRQLKADGAIQ
jgi:hypothetical protein